MNCLEFSVTHLIFRIKLIILFERMNRPNPQPENIVFIPYPPSRPPVVQQLPPNYLPAGSYYPVMHQMIIPMQQFIPMQPQQPPAPHRRPIKRTLPDNRPWTHEEDQVILNKFKAVGPRWELIANCLQDRSPSSVHNRAIELQRIYPIPSIVGAPGKPIEPKAKDKMPSCFVKYTKQLPKKSEVNFDDLNLPIKEIETELNLLTKLDFKIDEYEMILGLH
ncbi:hypothetical protein TRFO_27720 [Tritrichomonas foetus]|uniref:Myb-like domain-containing protein n=1 Tax=Tritrichomonas foetus TaxID=1144522 RepID=A0A1J4JZX4_9EUKA|nr:hypothetical protein TRFO_27720 [Tritrichomonas foetus]|eukprot:OHT04713.1 hypothetical protein TRFO_27720 [Tritrichomonas foetus]